jgi:GNAT superfamily N-acetyltransferase
MPFPNPQPLRYRDWPQVAALALRSLPDLQARTLRYYLCHHSNGFHVLREGRRVLGLSFVQLEPGSGELWLTMIAVDGDQRRHGLGSLLLQQVEARAAGMGLARVGLRCRQDNAQALAMYRRFGYAVTGESRHPRTGDPVFVLHKRLPAKAQGAPQLPLLRREVPRLRCWLNRAVYIGLFGLRV